jgi:hypothetical protein
MKKRSVGVTIFAILFIIGGVLGLLSAVVTPKMLRSIVEAPGITTEAQTQLKTTLNVFESRLVPMAAQAAAMLASGIGLLMLQMWAWWLTLVLVGISVLMTLVGLILQGGLGQGPGLAIAVFSLLFILGWNGFIAWFFLRASVKEQFAKTSG